MLTSFTIAVIFAATILYLPGYLLLRGIGFHRSFSVGIAPAAGIMGIGLLATIYSMIGMKSSPLNLFFIPFLLTVCAYSALRYRGHREGNALPADESFPMRFLVVVIAIGVSIGMLLFVRRLPSFDAVFQAWDYPHHLNEVKAFVDTETLSPIHGNVYASDQSIDPFIEAVSFYPSGWHMVCALVVMALDVSIPLSINAVNFVFSFIVFPVSMNALLVKLFPERKEMPVISTIASFSLAVFPWGVLTFGPIYPNLAGFAVLPGMIAAFIDTADEGKGSMLAIWLASCLGVLFLHPNVLFSMGIYLAPFIVHMVQTKHISCCIGKYHLTANCVTFVFVLLCVVLWVVAYNLPALAQTVTFVWNPYASISQAIVNLMTLTYMDGFFPCTAVQLVPAVILFVGFISIVRDNDGTGRWMVWPFAISAVFMVVAISSSGNSFLRHFLLGFWYTDPYRIAAMTTIFSMPILFRGICCCVERIDARTGTTNRGPSHYRNVALVGALYIGLVFYPSFQLAGLGKVNMAFTDVRNNIQTVYSYRAPLLEEERAFLAEVKDVVDDDLVINDPYDGSVMAYGLEGINCYYRYFDGFGTSSETPQSVKIRQNLNNIASDAVIQEAVQSLGAKYVLILDHSDVGDSFAWNVYRKEQWMGIESITDATPGFTMVLQKGDLRLYRIDAAVYGQ